MLEHWLNEFFRQSRYFKILYTRACSKEQIDIEVNKYVDNIKYIIYKTDNAVRSNIFSKCALGDDFAKDYVIKAKTVLFNPEHPISDDIYEYGYTADNIAQFRKVSRDILLTEIDKIKNDLITIQTYTKEEIYVYISNVEKILYDIANTDNFMRNSFQ